MTYVLAIDQGTTSTRAIIFDEAARLVASAQVEHRQIYPRAGWVEHDATEIWRNVCKVIRLAMDRANVKPSDLATVGITNQRETTVVWDRVTGSPVCNAIVWQDTRTKGLIDVLAASGGTNRYADVVGLPLATYFAGPKLRWILDEVPGAREGARRGDLLFGTIDTWLVWNLTGGPNGGQHVTDVTNASRTMLMDLDTFVWREDIADDLGIPLSLLPQIRSSSEEYGTGAQDGLLPGVPISGILGDQQAAMFGQACFDPGMAKNTYGTGNFLLLNTGAARVTSTTGLLTTVAYQLGSKAPVYALEGSIAVTGSLVQWLRDNLGLIDDASEIETLARSVDDNGGAYFVPAFSGLFAPHWRPDARGALVGLTGYVNKAHIARAALEATGFQTREVVEAMNADSGVSLTELRVDGGMVGNDLLMQFQADQLGVDAVRSEISETTALGAAFAAGIAAGVWSGTAEVAAHVRAGKRWSAVMSEEERDRLYSGWQRAVTKSLDWVDEAPLERAESSRAA